MKMRKKPKKILRLIVCLLIPLAVGGIAAFLTRDSMDVYENVTKPAGAPPGFIFPIAWTVLYILMGISLYLVYQSDSSFRSAGIVLFTVQLTMNFIWPLIFFNGTMYGVALIWLIALWGVILSMILVFYKVRPVSAWLQIPYLLWVAFAAYLNLGVAVMN